MEEYLYQGKQALVKSLFGLEFEKVVLKRFSNELLQIDEIGPKRNENLTILTTEYFKT